jgi:hypothetical protein
MTQEMSLQEQRRSDRVAEFISFFHNLKQTAIQDELLKITKGMNLKAIMGTSVVQDVQPDDAGVKLRRAPARDKRIQYDASLLPKLDKTKEYSSGSRLDGHENLCPRSARGLSGC